MTWILKCACWFDGENHNDELSRDDSFMYGWADGENHHDELSRDDSFMYGWADGENHHDELSRDDSFMYGWADGENHHDELSGDDICMYYTYNQRMEWFWDVLRKNLDGCISGHGKWHKRVSKVYVLLFFIPFLNQTFTRFMSFFNLASFHAILCSIMHWSVLNLSVHVFCEIYMIIGWVKFLNLSD